MKLIWHSRVPAFPGFQTYPIQLSAYLCAAGAILACITWKWWTSRQSLSSRCLDLEPMFWLKKKKKSRPLTQASLLNHGVSTKIHLFPRKLTLRIGISFIGAALSSSCPNRIRPCWSSLLQFALSPGPHFWGRKQAVGTLGQLVTVLDGWTGVH